MSDPHKVDLSPGLLLQAYSQGLFPMAENADDDDFFWVKPKMRGIIPLAQFHVPRSLKKVIKKQQIDINFDSNFLAVIDGCAETKVGREQTWINSTIRNAYYQLFQLGFCHTVEAWHNNKLVGGLYGIALGQAFFGESMFSRMTDASKICLVALVERLKKQNFTLLDTQFITTHLSRFGAIEIPQHDYERLLRQALKEKAQF